jgi:hypothetical protein
MADVLEKNGWANPSVSFHRKKLWVHQLFNKKDEYLTYKHTLIGTDEISPYFPSH